MSQKSIVITFVTCMIAAVGTFVLIDYLWLATTSSISHIENLGGGVRHDMAWGATVYEIVSLDDTDATDADMKYVRNLWPCYGVYLKNTEITDVGLKELHGLSLYEIDLRGTRVTPAGIKELRQSILNENCRIKY